MLWQSLCSLRLSSHQVNMLLTSLWIQATSTENTPANFEAMTITFNTTLLFSLAKVSPLLSYAKLKKKRTLVT